MEKVREILFRGKRADNGAWIYGYYTMAKWYLDEKGINVMLPIGAMFYPRSEISEWHEVLPETVGQYTGLTDKNGKKIFEGDILKGQYDEDSPEDIAILVVLWDNGWRIQQGDRVPDFLEELDCQICEVIGNIHDNPELLKGGEENAE